MAVGGFVGGFLKIYWGFFEFFYMRSRQNFYKWDAWGELFNYET